VVLASRLKNAIDLLNPQVPAAARKDAMQQVLKLDHPVQLSANQLFHRLLVNGVPVEYMQGGESRGDLVRLIDFAHPPTATTGSPSTSSPFRWLSFSQLEKVRI